MKFRPILFSTEMVQAILAGSKTQTRRIIKPQPTKIGGFWRLDKRQSSNRPFNEWHNHPFGIHSPYGQIADVLWVKETFYAYGRWMKNGTSKTGKQKWKFIRDKSVAVMYQDQPPKDVKPNSDRGEGWYKRPSLFMELSMIRIWLRITNIRVERLHDISEEDAKAEGVKSYFSTVFQEKRYKDYQDISSFFLSAISSFESLWHSINSSESWNANPWVWVVEFERIEKPENF